METQGGHLGILLNHHEAAIWKKSFRIPMLTEMFYSIVVQTHL
jgi:hypothetical protein